MKAKSFFVPMSDVPTILILGVEFSLPMSFGFFPTSCFSEHEMTCLEWELFGTRETGTLLQEKSLPPFVDVVTAVEASLLKYSIKPASFTLITLNLTL